MKWFWYSLIGFCLLMCSCSTKKSAHLINEASRESIQTEWVQLQALTDTSRVFRIAIDKTKLRITETINIRKYDKDTGAVTEETEAKREVVQDSDKVASEEGNQGVTNRNGLEAEQFREATKKIDSEVKEESESVFGGFWEQFGMYLGIFVGAAFIIWILMKKLR